MVARMTNHRIANRLAALPLLAWLAACAPPGPPAMLSGVPVKGPEVAAAPMPLPPPPGYGPAPTAPGYAAVAPGYMPSTAYGVPPPPGYAPMDGYGAPPPRFGDPVGQGVPPLPAPAWSGGYRGVPPPPGYGPPDGDGVPLPPTRRAAIAPPVPYPGDPSGRPAIAGGGGFGTAFAISQRGLAITNAHVIEGCRAVTDDQGRPLRVIAADRRRDLALLDAGRPFASVVRFRSEGGAALGETALVFGFPYGQALGTGINLTNGIVTGMTGMRGDPTRFQMNAAVQPGISGGPVVDDDGLLLGVAVGRLNDITVLRVTGLLPQSINFAIRAEAVEQFLAAQGVQPPRGGGHGASGARAVSARVAPAVFQVICRG